MKFTSTAYLPRIKRTFLNNWVIDLRSKLKRRKKMRKAKKKIRSKYSFMNGKVEISEQEYVDNKFAELDKTISDLEERISILDHLTSDKEYVLVTAAGNLYVDHEWIDGRKWCKENGYEYVDNFKYSGELWIKKEKKK